MIEHLSLPDVHALARDCLTRAGAPDAVAQAVAAEIAAAEAAGERQHGMEALLRDIRLMRYGRIDANAQMSHTHPRPGLIRCDAAHGFAAAALAGAIGPLIELTRHQGIALLRLDRASDPGAMIHATATLAKSDLVALAFGPAGPGRIAHPDIGAPAVLRHPPRDTLGLLLPARPDRQPADGPLGAAVMHGAWIVAVDTAAAGETFLAADIRDIAQPAPEASEIACSTELLEQIVTA
jgi:(2R)-3-sulfolactate dehydrogenase (NADP+)